jgi:hypothetical protein
MDLITNLPSQQYCPLDILEAIQTQQINPLDLKYVLVYSIKKDPDKFYMQIHYRFLANRNAALWAKQNKTKNQRVWIPPSLYM